MIDLVELKSDFGLKYQTKTKVTKTKIYFFVVKGPRLLNVVAKATR